MTYIYFIVRNYVKVYIRNRIILLGSRALCRLLKIFWKRYWR